MRRQSLISLLEYEASRQPALAAMIANLDHMSEDAIQSAKVRLPWMRQALLQMKRDRTTPVLDDSRAVTSVVADPQGEMRQWTGDLAFVRVGGTQLEVTPGQLIWFGPTGVWIDTIYATLIDPQLLAHTVSCGRVSKSHYLDAVRNRTRQLPAASDTPISATGIRFYRPA